MASRVQTRAPVFRLRPWLFWAALVAGAGFALGRRHRTGAAPTPPVPVPAAPPAGGDVSPAASEENRIEALTKLKGLRDEGVLTEEQYESERRRLTQGIR